MTWEETVKYVRTLPDFASLVEKAYIDERLDLNVKRYMASEEWQETLTIVKKHAPVAQKILDVGSGNGISVIAFALTGYNVVAVEPNPSETVGTGAISNLIKQYKLTNITIIETYAENAELGNLVFDVVYCRQSMHHANNLNRFVKNISSYLKLGGLFFTVRDHISFDVNDKKWFLRSHPLQKYYEGENAFKPSEYRKAFKYGNLSLIKEVKYYECIINYFPLSENDLKQMKENRSLNILNASKKIPLASLPIFYPIFQALYNIIYGKVYNEKKVPGRVYSYIAIKTK
jgi:SAM-dependent methyltransferase